MSREKVQRCDPEGASYQSGACMTSRADGDYVWFDDYESLLREVEELEKEREVWNCKLVREEEEEAMTEFRRELQALLNCCSMENGSNTPDYVLAEYLEACLAAFDAAVRERGKWYQKASKGEEPDA